MVRIRARDFRSWRIFLMASTSPSASLKFKRNSDSFKRAASACRSSSGRSRYLSTSSRLFIVRCAHCFEFRVSSFELMLFPNSKLRTPNSKLDCASFLLGTSNKLCLNRKFLCCQLHRFARSLLIYSLNLVKNASGFNHGDPVFRCALTFSHARFRRLLRHRLIRKHSNPNLPAAFDMPRHRNTRCFDLPIRDPSRLEALQPVLTEANLAAAIRDPTHAAAHLLAMLNFFRHQHDDLSLGPLSTRTRGASSAFARTGTRFVNRIGPRAAGHRSICIQDLATIDPNFHANDSERRVCFSKSIINVGTQGMQRLLSLQVPFTTRDLSAIQPAADFDLDSLRPKAQRFLHGFAHRPAKRDSLFKLRRNLFSLQLGV